MSLTAISSKFGLICPAEKYLSGKLTLEELTFSSDLRSSTLYCFPCALKEVGDSLNHAPSLIEQLPEGLKRDLRVTPVNGSIRLNGVDSRIYSPHFRHLRNQRSCAALTSRHEDHLLLVGIFAQNLINLYQLSNPSLTFKVETEVYFKTSNTAHASRRYPDISVSQYSLENPGRSRILECAEVLISSISPEEIRTRTEDLVRTAPRVTWYLSKQAFVHRITDISRELLTLAEPIEVRLFLFWKKGEELFYSQVSLENSSEVIASLSGPRVEATITETCQNKRGASHSTFDRPHSRFNNIRIASPICIEGEDCRTSLEFSDQAFKQLEIDLSLTSFPTSQGAAPFRSRSVKQTKNKQQSESAIQLIIPDLPL